VLHAENGSHNIHGSLALAVTVDHYRNSSLGGILELRNEWACECCVTHVS